MYAVIGLGKTGISIAKFLTSQKFLFFVCDTRKNPPELLEFKNQFPTVECILGKLPEEKLCQAEKIILSPGLARTIPELQKALRKNIPVIGDIELFVQQAKAPIIAVTGTNAKGTVTTMLESILKAANKQVWVGGNIGIPALNLFEKPIPDFYILELSSFQLESTFSLKAAAATILNLSEDHLDHHGSMENYIAAKQRIYQGAEAIVFNAEDKRTQPVEQFRSKSIFYAFGLSTPDQNHSFGFRNETLMFNDQTILHVDELPVVGKHNWANALAASALAVAVGIPLEAIKTGLKNYRGLKHRCALVETIENISWYNDSKGTNVGATQAAISGLGPTLEGKIVWIAGGQAKGQNFSPLQTLCQQYVKALILLGQDADQLEKVLSHHSPKCLRVKNLEEAVNAAKKIVQAGDAVLFSPACASLDMFKNYEDRGEQFEKIVRLSIR